MVSNYSPKDVTRMLFSPEIFTKHNRFQLTGALREDPFRYLFELFEKSDTNSTDTIPYTSMTLNHDSLIKFELYRTYLTQERIEGFISIDDTGFRIEADRHGNFVCMEAELARGCTTTLVYLGMPWIELTNLEGFLTSRDSLRTSFPEKASDTLTEFIMSLDEKKELESVLEGTPYKKLSSSWDSESAVLLETADSEKILVTPNGVSLPRLKTHESVVGTVLKDGEKYVKPFSDFKEGLNG